MDNKTILVVDDDQDLCDSLLEILENEGFKAIGCETAEAALQQVKADTPHLAIIDNMMPGMRGMTLLPLLKKEYPGIKIIMISAFSTVDNAVTAIKNGADDYLAKPFKRDELLMTVKRNLEELKFEQLLLDCNMDDALSSLANPLRRQILSALSQKREMRFMDITRYLKISDHTKVNFHLKNLKNNNLICQNSEKNYQLTAQGDRILQALQLFSKKTSTPMD